MPLIFLSFIVFILVAVAFLSKADTVLTRTSLALAGVLVTALGLMSGWGWGMIFGMPFTPLQREFSNSSVSKTARSHICLFPKIFKPNNSEDKFDSLAQICFICPRAVPIHSLGNGIGCDVHSCQGKVYDVSRLSINV